MRESRLIIFDCDGVLVDSELIACQSVAICLEEYGVSFPVQDVVRSYAGVSALAMIADLNARFPGHLPENFGEVLAAKTREAFDRGLKPMDGVEEVLSAIPFRVCVASSSSTERIGHSLQITGLLKYFHRDSIFSATQVERGKPAPDLFLYAAGRMHVRPKDCVVVEDSRHGVQGARAAGMVVLGFTGGSHCKPEDDQILLDEGAAAAFRQMSQLTETLSDLS
jgi:HAD superfamily hydrolase (TIGR01509 family)